MSKIKVTSFRYEDYLSMGDTVAGTDCPPIVSCYPAVTVSVDDRVMVCAGLVPLSEGRATVWACVSPAVKDSPDKTEIVRAIRHCLRTMAPGFRVHRVEAEIDPAFRPGVALLIKLGFRFESVMRSYTPDGIDYHHYVWLL